MMAEGGARRRRRWWLATIVGVGGLAALVGVVVVATHPTETSWGTPTDRVVSPTGAYEVVVYEWSAMIDPGWTLAVERVDGEGREWFWRSAELPAFRSVRFVDATTIEVTDDLDQTYRVHVDPTTLEPSDRYCPRPEYCWADPWSGYTSEGP